MSFNNESIIGDNNQEKLNNSEQFYGRNSISSSE